MIFKVLIVICTFLFHSLAFGASEFEQLSTSANNGDAAAQFKLAKLYFEGKATKKNDREAFRYASMAVFGGNNNAEQWVKKNADSGNKYAQNALGNIYNNHESYKNDKAKQAEAVKSYKASAKQGNEVAKSNLAHMYIEGRGVEKNYKQAESLLIEAFDAGYVYAATSLGVLYLQFDSGLQDTKKAISYLEKGAQANHQRAFAILGMTYYNGFMDIAKDYQKAFTYLKQAESLNMPEVLSHLGNCYLNGHGTNVDAKKGKEYIQKAANLGYSPAVNQLSQMTAPKNKVENSPKQKYFQLSEKDQGACEPKSVNI